MRNMVQPVTAALDINNVTKLYTQWQRSGKLSDVLKNMLKPQKRTIKALDAISLNVSKGEFIAYAGANGAGKSTTIKILSGILQPTSGKVSVLGLDPAKERVALMRRIGIVFGQRSELWWDHPVITSYEWKKSVWNIPRETFNGNLEMLSELLDLKDILYTFARELSLGQRMKADIAMMLLHDPELIFLDEPTLGLDVLAKRQIIDFLKQINTERKTTIIVTSHDMDDLEEMAKRIVLLSTGKITFDGGFDELRRSLGSICRIRITTASDIAPRFDTLRFVSSQKNIHEYEFDRERSGIREVLAAISQIDGVKDVEIKKRPIEDVIASLYTSWKRQP